MSAPITPGRMKRMPHQGTRYIADVLPTCSSQQLREVLDVVFAHEPKALSIQDGDYEFKVDELGDETLWAIRNLLDRSALHAAVDSVREDDANLVDLPDFSLSSPRRRRSRRIWAVEQGGSPPPTTSVNEHITPGTLRGRVVGEVTLTAGVVEQWQCKSCTLLNSVHRKSCELCGDKKPVLPSSSRAPPSQEVPFNITATVYKSTKPGLKRKREGEPRSRRFKCPFCDKTFEYHCNMLVHKRTHTGEKPYVCKEPGCNAAYAHPASLRAHVCAVHLKIKPYKCTVAGCNKEFANKSNLNRHLKKFHPDQYHPQRKKPKKVSRQNSFIPF